MRTRILGIVLTIVLATSCFFSNCTLMSVEAATDVCITADGNLLDWDFIQKMYTGNGRIVQVAAFQTDDSVYIMREFSDVASLGGDQLFFDTDGNPTNGYLNAGIDWMLQGDTWWKHDTEKGGFNWIEQKGDFFTAKKSDDNSVAEFVFPLTSFPDYTGGQIRINVNPYASNWSSFASYPASSSDLAVIPAYADVYHESNALPIENVALAVTGGSLQAITEPTMQGGVAGILSAEGGDGENYTFSFADSDLYGVDNNKFTISGNKLIVKDSLLAPGSYSIYVSVRSDVRNVKAALTFVVGAASPNAVITENVFSGKNAQWFAVNYNAANTIPTLNALKAVTDGTYLYAYVDAASLSNFAAFYIATSAEGGANITDTWADATSVKYKVDMEGKLYEYTGDWNEVGTADIYKTAMGAEIKVALSAMGNASGTLRVGIKDGESCFLPNQGQNMYSLITPIPGDMPEITHDGDPSDWAEIEPIAAGTGSVGDLYAMHDDEYLYVMTHLSDVEDHEWLEGATSADPSCIALSTNLLINADGDPTTGFQSAVYPDGSGADFLIQDWFCVNSTKENVEFFYTTDTTGGWTNREGHTSYKKATEVGNGTWCIEFALPISEMKKATNTVSDDMYVVVHRSTVGLQGGTKEGGTAGEAFAYVPKYTNTVPVNVGDDSFADWNNVARKATNTSSESTCNLLATKSDERLYTIVTNELGGLNTVNTYYISTSVSGGDATGYTISGYENVDYVVKDAKLYQVTADNTIEVIDDAWMSYYNDNVEMQLYLSQIGNPETIRIAYRGASGSLALPSDGSMMNVTATFEMEREDGYYYPTEDFATYTNPYKGWVIWGTPGEEIPYENYEKGTFYFDSDMVYLCVRWSELQPNSDQDWELDNILKNYNVPEWLAAGKRINLRFVMDNPEYLGADERRMDIPQWLYDELVEADKAAGGDGSGAGTFYHDVDGSLGLGYDQAGFSPNYNNPKMIERHDEIIMKLAKYFDNTEITSFVQIGSLGHWGEMHTWPEGTGVWPNPSTVGRYMEAYTKAFKNVKLGTRKPYPYAAANNFGLFNDIFGVDEWGGPGTRDFYDYFMNGCWDMGGGATGEEVEASKMPDFWKYNYSGGEFANGQIRNHITNETAADGTKGTIGVIDEVRYTHVSWMGPCSPSTISWDELDGPMYEANVYAILKAMGYNFALEKIDQLSEIEKGTANNVSMTWNNEGVAPFYYEWPIEFSLIDAQGNVAYATTFNSGITNWLPGRTDVNVSLKIPGTVPAGNYTLAVAIADMDTYEPGLKLAIEGGREDKRYPLYSVNVSGENTTYSIRFDANGGTGTMADIADLANETVKLSANAFEREGYVFTGWNTQADGSGKKYKNNASVNNLATGNEEVVTLYAQWRPIWYATKFNGNGATSGETKHIPFCDYDQTYELTANAYQRTGYTFTGWNTEADGSGQPYADMASVQNLTTVDGADVILYAQWTANKYNVVFDGNNATSGTTAGMSEIKYDETVALTANAYQRDGYTFAGWNTKADGTGKAYADKASVQKLTDTNDATVTLYAQWTANKYTIKFDKNGGTGTMNSMSDREYNKDYTLTANAYKKEGYTFAGWNTKADGKGTKYADKASVKNLAAANGASITLYAQWTANKYTIKFDKNGGTGTMNSMSDRIYGTKYTLTANAYKKEGYTFAGWNTKADGKGTKYVDKASVQDLISTNGGSITLYAQWTKDTYKISYTLNNGKNNKNNPKTYTVTSNTIKLKNPTRKGYTFKGWYKDSKFKTKKVTEIKKGSTGNVKLYAKWAKTSYKITYKLDGGKNSKSNPKTYTIVSKTIKLKAPTKKGYTFKGWYKDKKFKKKVTQIKKGSTGKVTLYAKWAKESYKITYKLNGGKNNKSNPSKYSVTTKTIKLKAPTKKGYTFKGWYKDKKFKNKVTQIKKGSTGKITLYAKWVKKK